MLTYVVNIYLRGIVPQARNPALDEIMSGIGFLPWRPGVPAEAADVDKGFVQWEYAGNHSLGAEELRQMLEARIMSEVQPDIEVTVTRVTVTSGSRPSSNVIEFAEPQDAVEQKLEGWVQSVLETVDELATALKRLRESYRAVRAGNAAMDENEVLIQVEDALQQAERVRNVV
jgi:hypothetical protein